MRSRPGGTKRQLTARFVAKGFTQKVNIDEIYAATPAAITLRILLTQPQHIHEQQYLSNLRRNVNKTTTLWKLNKQLYGLRDSPQKFQLHLSSILKQLRSDHCVYHNDDITVMVYMDDLPLTGDDDKIKAFQQQLEGQLQLKHVTKLERGQPL
eukprot:2387814-Amphidinium_carterae.1